ncbi:zinc carboxypeptidase A 1-like [Malaya genurostris]|uniref:zinc carboxypeptidase A 1-like n=1 Tax=Malaya genurostris TaxID=325434 RepID=UPI0026F39FB5|nr:zinc carboxypeptidase A 1-like [Malaya genurostris]
MVDLRKLSGVILSLVLCCDVGLGAESARYDNYRNYKVRAHSAEHVSVLKELKESSDSFIFLEHGNKAGDEYEIVVAPHKLADFTTTLESYGISYYKLQTNLQQLIDEERNRIQTKRASGAFGWIEYHELEEIYAWLDKLASEYKQVEVIEGGRTFENRKIKGVKVSYKTGNPGIFLEAGIHAREWIAPATATYILNQLLTSNDTAVRNIAENYDWYIFPSVNPDGYVYTHKRDRLWRKTRTRYAVGCFGADPNRNWDFHWHEQGTSSWCYSDTYGGPRAFSEVETKTLSEYIQSLKGKLRTYISFHSYSQLLLFPYGYTSEHASNYDDLNSIAKATVTSLARRYGTQYTYGNVYDAIYPASGASFEWVYGTLGVKLAYTYELRPSSNSRNGFILPPSQIIPTGEETLDSLVTLLEESAKKGYYGN